MSMHNEAERLRVLAETLDPRPPRPPMRQDYAGNVIPFEPWLELSRPRQDWRERDAKRLHLIAIATPRALLGAAVDLLEHALGPEKAMELVYAASFDGMLLADPMAMLRRLLDDADAMLAEDNDD